MHVLRWIVDAAHQTLIRPGLSTLAMYMALEAGGEPPDHSAVAEKSEPHYFEYGEYEDLWKAETPRSTKGHPQLRRQLVIKVIKGVVHDENRKRLFTKRLLGRLKTSDKLRLSTHPNIVPVCGLVTNKDFLPSPVIPFYKNGDVLQYLAKVPNANKYQIITDVANALKFLHSREIPVIHGNLKASNILIEDDGRALISDIGIHTVMTELDSTVADISNSCRWTAPEILQPPEEDEEESLSAIRTRATDVYAFGMTVLEIYTGKKPFFNRPQDLPIVVAVCRGNRPSRPESSEITDDLWSLIRDCWKGDPGERPSMAEVHERLIEHLR